MSSASKISTGQSPTSNSVPDASKGCCSASCVAKWALAFFLLSGAAMGALYGLKITSYLPVPIATGGLSFIVGAIASMVHCCKHASFSQPRPGTKTISSSIYNKGATAAQLKEAPLLLVDEINPKRNLLPEEMRYNACGIGVRSIIGIDIYFHVDGQKKASPGSFDLMASAKEYFRNKCMNQARSAPSYSGKRLLDTGERPIFVEKPDWDLSRSPGLDVHADQLFAPIEKSGDTISYAPSVAGAALEEVRGELRAMLAAKKNKAFATKTVSSLKLTDYDDYTHHATNPVLLYDDEERDHLFGSTSKALKVSYYHSASSLFYHWTFPTFWGDPVIPIEGQTYDNLLDYLDKNKDKPGFTVEAYAKKALMTRFVDATNPQQLTRMGRMLVSTDSRPIYVQEQSEMIDMPECEGLFSQVRKKDGDDNTLEFTPSLLGKWMMEIRESIKDFNRPA